MTGSLTSHNPDIAGYDFGSVHSAKSPVSTEELLQLEQTLGWTTNDAHPSCSWPETIHVNKTAGCNRIFARSAPD
jgi:hypothetical protein